jgi:predicted nucleotidyltransferase
MKRDDLLQLIKNSIRLIEPDAEIILYGSRSRKESTPESDWDLLILIDGPAVEDRIDRIRHSLYEVEWDTGQVISSIVRNSAEWHSQPNASTPLYQNVSQEGTTL